MRAFDRRDSGIGLVGDLPWGTHFCQFYDTRDELLELLVPYFRAGIQNNELCLWRLGGASEAAGAARALTDAEPAFAGHLAAGRIRVLQATAPHAPAELGGEEIARVLDAAVLEGFDGLRLATPAPPTEVGLAWHLPGAGSLRTLNLIVLVLYPRKQVDVSDLLAIVKEHRCALVRDAGGWKVLEGSHARATEDDLERSEEKLRSLFATMSEGFAFHRIVLDAAGEPCDYVFLEVNQAFARLTGLDPEHIVGRRVTTLLPGIRDDPTDWIGRYGRVALTMQPAQFESHAAALGKWFAVSAFSPHRGFFAVTFADITARKRAEAERQAIEERLRITLRSIGDAVLSADADGRVTFLNPVAAALTGWTEAEALGKPAVEVFRTVDGRTGLPAEDIVGRVLRESRAVLLANNTSIVARDGRMVPIEDSAAPILAAGGGCAGVVLVFHDVTAKREAQEALRRAHDELEQRVDERTRELADANRELRALAGELTLAEQRERRRIARLLHDHLQQLLVASKFRVTALRHSPDGGARATGEQISAMLDEAIQASRTLTAELSPPILYERGLGAALRWLVTWMLEKHGLAIDLSDHGTPANLAEDVVVLLFESVREVLFNVVKHAGVQRAAIDIGREGDSLQIAVSDGGTGFESGVLRPPGPGGGFGLFGIRERLTLLGGRLTIDSAPGRGTRVVLSAPVPRAAVAGTRSAAAGAPDAAPAAPRDSIRVLVVDDHAVMREGLSRMLTEEGGIEVVGEADDGQKAIELAWRLSPDVVLMDVTMAALSGIDATRVIHSSMPEVKIIGLSMLDEAGTAQEMLAAGATAYLTKSGPVSQIVRAVRACTGRADPPAAP